MCRMGVARLRSTYKMFCFLQVIPSRCRKMFLNVHLVTACMEASHNVSKISKNYFINE